MVKKCMTADTVIPKFDTDLGPSKPQRKQAEPVASKKDAVVVSRFQAKKKRVTALAISEGFGGKQVMYSGHGDGVLAKWSLQDNKLLWSRQIYPDNLDQWDHRCISDSSFNIQDSPGVAGLAVRPDLNQKGLHLLYTWTHGESGPSRLRVWSGTSARLVRKHVCDIGNDNNGRKACPDISTVVFCPLLVENRLVDSVLVGFHCRCSVLEYDESYTGFNLKKSQEHSEGNILPFYEHPTDGTGSMDSWRGHHGMIQAMAVIEGKFLLSYSIQSGHGAPDAMILWSLSEPGVPLFRKDLWDSSRNILQQPKTRLHGVCGIGVCGYDVVFADIYGFRVAKVEERGNFNLEGYDRTGPAVHGRMASSRSFAAMASESDSTVCIYKIKGNSGHSKLDRGDIKDGNKEKFDRNDSQSGPEEWRGRGIAVAQVEIPKFGGNAPSTKKQKRDDHSGDSISRRSFTSEERMGGLGNGGPTAITMRGRNLVTGFSNGTIANTTLPHRFNEEPDSESANHLSCCSVLASDKWHHPMLEHKEKA